MWAILRGPCDENLIRAGAPAAPEPRSRGRWILAATILASSMAFIDSTVVNVALPALQTHLKASALGVQWVVEAYSLLLSAFLLVGGSLGDHYGRRRIFLLGITIFAIASAGCGLAANITQLIIARAAQGFGAALLVPESLAIISSSYSEKERGRAIGTWSGVSAITSGIGPLLGGWLIEHVSWRAVFFINLPIALIVILISFRHIGETAERENGRIDWLGAILAVFGLGALVYGLIESSRAGFGHVTVISTLCAGAAFLSAFLLIEWRSSHPMLPLELFRSRNFAGTNLLTFLLYAALSGTLFFLPLNLIQVQGYSATAAGAALLPFILIMSLLSRWSGGLVTRYGPKPPLVLGPLLTAGGYILFLFASAEAAYWKNFFPPIAMVGLGMAITVAPLTTTVMSSVPQSRAGIASGVNNAVARTAGLIAIAVLGIMMLNVFRGELNRQLEQSQLSPAIVSSVAAQSTRLAAITIPHNLDPTTQQFVRRAIDHSFIGGFHAIMVIGAALALSGAVSALIFFRAPSRAAVT